MSQTGILDLMEHETEMSMHDVVSAEAIVEELRLLADSMSSHKALAAKIGISPAYLSDILKGRRNPGSKVCKFLKVEPVPVYREIK
jgi:transcriptional regulator with XRE-family HTH domain